MRLRAYRGAPPRSVGDTQEAEPRPWDKAVESQLRKDYDGNYERDQAYIRHAYEYGHH